MTVVLSSLGCSINVAVLDKTTQSTSFDFLNSNQFEFNDNQVNIDGGSIGLKPIDLVTLQDDFTSGHSSGVRLVDNQLQITQSQFYETHPSWTPQWDQVIGYWPFNNGWEDPIGGSVSSVSGDPKIGEGLFGDGAGSFDGDTDQVVFTLSDENSLSRNDDFTVSGWFFSDRSHDSPTATNLALIRLACPDGYVFEQIFQDAGGSFPGRVRFNRHIGGPNSSVDSLGNYSLPIDEWTHFVLLKRGNTLEHYINGSIIESKTARVFDDFKCNQMSFSLRNYKGFIDEVTLWKVGLDANEVKNVYNTQAQVFQTRNELSPHWTPKWDHLTGYWKLDGNWDDSFGKELNGTAVNDATFDSFDKKIGTHSAQFDGSDDYVTLASTDLLKDKSYSLSTWVRFDAVPLIWGAIFWQQESQLYFTSDQEITFRHVDTTNTNVSVSHSTPLELGQWYHIGVVANDQTLNLFLDGQKVDSKDISHLGDPRVVSIAQLGRNENSNGSFHGRIDDFAVWETALQPAEMKLIYNRQKQKHGGFYDSEVKDLGASTSTLTDLSWTTPLPFGKELVGGLSDGLVAYWNLNETVAGTAPGQRDFRNLAQDEYHGELSSGTLKGGGLLGNGLDTSQNFVTSFFDFTAERSHFSLGAWVRSTATDKFFDIFSRRIGTTGNFDGLNCFIHGVSGKLSCRRHINGQTNVVVEDPEVRNNGKWVHFVYTYDGSTSRLYVDGLLTDSRPDPSTMLPLPGQALKIGEGSGGTPGVVDEPAVWSRALSEHEVAQLYRRGANRVRVQVKSCIDPSCLCKSFGPSPFASVTDCDGDGIENSNDGDDIHRARFIGPGGDGTTAYSELYNRAPEHLLLNCDQNNTDSNALVCSPDEIAFFGGSLPSAPIFTQEAYPDIIRPQSNRYFQYRVYLEAEGNRSCGGGPCLPELTSVRLDRPDRPRYFGITQTVDSLNPIPYRAIASIDVNADSCVEFQLSPDRASYYFWNGQKWEIALSEGDRSSVAAVQSHIYSFSEQFPNGNFYFRAFFSSDTTTPCRLHNMDLNYKRPL